MANTDNNDIIKNASENLGIDQSELKKASQTGGKSILNGLSGSNREKVMDILESPEKTKQVLSSPKAQEILRKLLGEK